MKPTIRDIRKARAILDFHKRNHIKGCECWWHTIVMKVAQGLADERSIKKSPKPICKER